MPDLRVLIRSFAAVTPGKNDDQTTPSRPVLYSVEQCVVKPTEYHAPTTPRRYLPIDGRLVQYVRSLRYLIFPGTLSTV